jgi:hypothetical protein
LLLTSPYLFFWVMFFTFSQPRPRCTVGLKNIEMAKQASEALRPFAGEGAYWLFT